MTPADHDALHPALVRPWCHLCRAREAADSSSLPGSLRQGGG